MTDVKPLKITETVLRDGPQSLVATRMRVQDMIPVLEKLDAVGYHAIEAWGGATFDACLRFLDDFKRIMMLCKRHCAGVKPAVDHLRHTVHRLAALRTRERDRIDVRTVQLNLGVVGVA